MGRSPQSDSTAPRHLVYFADPMCSWFWGFSPVIHGLVDHFGPRLPVTLVIGGLRPGTREPMSAAMRTEIRDHWQHVHERTGQPFDFSFFERQRFVYDTEPADRAVVVMRLVNPMLTLAYFTAIQRAFYAEGRDVTDEAVLGDLAADHGIDRDKFLEAMATPEARRATLADFETARDSGVTGFPTVYAGDTSNGYARVTAGYRPLDGLAEALEAWLAAA